MEEEDGNTVVESRRGRAEDALDDDSNEAGEETPSTVHHKLKARMKLTNQPHKGSKPEHASFRIGGPAQG